MRLLLSFLFFLTSFVAGAQLPKLIVPIGHTNPVVGLATDPSNTYLLMVVRTLPFGMSGQKQ